MIQNLINHVVFVVDKSGSMSHFEDEVVKVFDTQIEYLARRSKELNQETRASVYLFSDKTECLVYDIDCLRLPSLKYYYNVGGNTALIDAVHRAMEDLSKTPQLYGDHAFLLYCLTDGEENASRKSVSSLKHEIEGLPDNWTIAVLTPDQRGVFESKKIGFPTENIQIWDTTSTKGLEEAGRVIRETTDNYMLARAKGVRSTKTLFKLDVNLSAAEVQRSLKELNPSQYLCINVYSDSDIKGYIESYTKEPYRVGSAYYQLMKKETIQANKQICVQNTANGRVYSGQKARDLISLPDTEVKVEPGQFNGFAIFVQSKSVNRKLIKGTHLIVLK